MKEYEVVHEIFNECANNQMRDVFFEEVALEDPEQYIRSRHKDRELKIEREDLEDGTDVSKAFLGAKAHYRAEIYLHGDLRAKRKGLAALRF